MLTTEIIVTVMNLHSILSLAHYKYPSYYNAINNVHGKVKVKVNHAPQESIGGAHLPLPGLEPIGGGEPLMSVTSGQCNARPMVTFPAARQHCPLAGTKLYCLVTVTEAHVFLTSCPGLHSTAGRLGLEPVTYWLQVQHPTATPPSRTMAEIKSRDLQYKHLLPLYTDCRWKCIFDQ